MADEVANEVDCIVIGAGVIGLAVARELAMAGREVVVLEKAGAIGTEISSRNSEVIHAGLYYPTDSLKAKFCAPGRALLYDYCRSHGVAHRRLGKLVVASSEAEIGALEGIAAHARANGVDAREQTAVQRVEFDATGVTAHIDAGGAKSTLRARYLVDASGRDTLLGKQLKLVERNAAHQSAAMFAHYRGVAWNPDDPGGKYQNRAGRRTAPDRVSKSRSCFGTTHRLAC